MLFNGDFRCVLQHQQLSPSSLICFRQERCWSNRCFVWFCWFTFLWTFSNHARRDTSYTNISLSLYRKTFGGVAWEIVSLFGNMWFFVDGSPSVSFFSWQLTHVLIFLDILYGSHILSSKSQIKTHSEMRDKTLWMLKNFLFTQIGFPYCKSFLRFKKTNFWSKSFENILQHYQSRF
jgi:hypothetical protein